MRTEGIMAVEHFSRMWRVAPCPGASLLALLSLADNAGGSGHHDDLWDDAQLSAVAHAARVSATALQHDLKALEVDGLIAELTIGQNRIRCWLACLEQRGPALAPGGNHQ